MNKDDVPTLNELQIKLNHYNVRAKQLIKERDEILELIIETEFKIFNNFTRKTIARKTVKFQFKK